MPSSIRLAAGIAILVAFGSATIACTTQGPVATAVPAPTPNAAATTAPPPTVGAPATQGPIDTSTWTTYTSELYGFTIAHPVGWTETPGDHDWDASTEPPPWDSTATDSFNTPGAAEGQGVRVSAWSSEVEPGTTLETWIEAYCADLYVGRCGGIPDSAVDVETGDGRRGLGLFEPGTDVMAFFLHDQTIYAVGIWREENDPSVKPFGGARRLLEGFISTMNLPA